MAFSSGFFNSKGLDRTYTAEDFCDYLGSLICNGIQDRYGDCFALSPNTGQTVSLGTGKAWISGHFFLSNDNYTIDLSRYRDGTHPRYVSIGIVLDTAEGVRDVKIEAVPGTPAEEPAVPDIPSGGSRTVLYLYAVLVKPGAVPVTADDIIDYREDENRCGYCKCILGKCRVADVMAQCKQAVADMERFNDTVDDLENRIAEIETAIEDIGDITEMGQCGDNVFYALYSTGKLLLKGRGDMYDYGSPLEPTANDSPFYNNQNIKNVVVSEGITDIGEYAFRYCDELETISLPGTLTKIGDFAFYPHPDESAVPTISRGLKEVTIPGSVTEIGYCAFAYNRLTTVTIPRTVTTIGQRVFTGCANLTTVRYEAPVINEFMFVNCNRLVNVTLARTVTEIKSHCFNYCRDLTEITYEGSLADWAAVTKHNNWDAHDVYIVSTNLTRINCLDGFMEWDEENHEWKVGE